MKKLIPMIALCLPCFAQILTLTCPASVKAGTTLTCAASLTASSGSAGLQFTVTSPPTLGTLTSNSTGASLSVSKSAYQTATSILLGGFGPGGGLAPIGVPGSLNTSQMGDGIVVNLNWQIPSTLANQTVQISLAGGILPPMATTPDGSMLPLTPNPPQSVAVLPNINFCDVDGDGQVNQADVTAQIALVLTFPQSSKCSRNANGCNVGAVEIVTVAALGGVCKATQ